MTYFVLLDLHAANDQTYAEIKAGVKIVTANQLPRFLYPDDHVYNADDEEDKLCHGHVYIRCARHILLGHGKAIQRPAVRKGKSGNAEIMGVKRVTPRIAAYIGIQTRFALCDMQEWCKEDRHFDLEVFYWNMVAILESEAGGDILKYLDRAVFGPVSIVDPAAVAGTAAVGPTPAERIKAQREAKRARLQQEEIN
ncbi:hypothetical protein NM688_g829 [Phlebia brevispora]|uniref:Uncharacterized protein n=1 Tax=Phlebia brevispora TaxID=194682 RepID=A0ACC1TD37_9APHY|nr:hypothetical protein NM688_g829 [Phlebia brevispora]